MRTYFEGWNRGWKKNHHRSSGRKTAAARWTGLESLESRVLLTAVPVGTPQLVADINTIGAVLPSSSPYANLTNVNGELYFTTSDDVNGTELWKSDGTAGGTVMVRDIDPGSASSTPTGLLAVGNLLFFTANNGVDGLQVWRSDGTTAGTFELTNQIGAGRGGKTGAVFSNIVNLNGEAYFGGLDANLYKSDGTVAGTVQVAPFGNPNLTGGGAPRGLVVAGNKFYFTASDTTNINSLWVSDGTTAGTTLLPNGLGGRSLTNVNGTLFFEASDGTGQGEKIWKSDGTSAGTVMVTDLVPSGNTTVGVLTAAGSKAYFTFNDGTHGAELWVTDGTAAGTTIVADINPGTLSSTPSNLTPVGNKLFFLTSSTINGSQLYVTDGTTDGTVGLSTVDTPSTLANINGELYYSTLDFTNGTELWKSDGTLGGTAIVAHTGPGTVAFAPALITSVGGGNLFFVVDDGVHGPELWKSNGTAGGTALVKNIYPATAGSNPIDLVAGTTNLYFLANDGVDGQQLWTTTGTGATMLTTAAEGTITSVTPPVVVGNEVYFVFNGTADGNELWKSDGTPAGTMLVDDLNPGTGGSNPSSLTATGSRVFFIATTGLWASDGTQAGTTLVLNTQSGGIINSLTGGENDAYFIFNTLATGTEIWKSDGTAVGTVAIDLNPGSGSSSVSNLTPVGSELYFDLNNTASGNELWKSDGTVGGSSMVDDINPGTASSNPTNLTPSGSKLFFSATDPTHGTQLWITDGTTGGTKLLSSFNGNNDPVFTDLTDVNGTVFWQGGELFGTTGLELYKSDGTAAGTGLVDDIAPGSSSGSPISLTNVGGTLYFVANNGSKEVWQSDGTVAGTFPIAPAFFTIPTSLIAANNHLFFVANDNVHGAEIWGVAEGAPLITVNPGSLSVSAGTDAMFTAAATGTPTPTVQWFVDTAGNGSYSPISGSTSATLDLGPATLDERGNQYEAVFTNSAGVSTTTTAMLTVTAPVAGIASQLVFTTPPAGAIAGTTLPSVVVKIEDSQGIVEAGDNSTVTLTLPQAPSGGVFTGSSTVSVAAVNGVATFSNLTLDTAGFYQLAAGDASDNLSGFNSTSFQITNASASQLVFTTTPTSGIVGQVLTPVVVMVEDPFGNVVTGYNSSLGLNGSVGSTSGGIFTPSSTTTTNAVNGVATFDNVAIAFAGSCSLIVIDTHTGALPQAVSASFPVSTAAGPVVTTSTGSAAYTQGNPATVIDPALTITDSGNSSIKSATVQITQNFATGEDALAFTNSGTITGSFVNDTLTLNGTATLAQYQTALRSITYIDSSANPSTLPRTVSFTVTDANNNASNVATRAVTVAAASANPLPDIVGQITDILFNGHSIASGNLPVLIPGDKLTVKMTVTNQGDGAFSASSASIIFTASTTQAPGDIPLQTFNFTNPHLAAGASSNQVLTLVVPDTLVTNSYFLVATLSAPGVQESNPNNNVVPSAFTLPFALEAGQVGSRSNVTITLPAGNNTLATFSLSGGGTAEVTPIAGQNGAESFDLTINGVTSKSAVTITAKSINKSAPLGAVVLNNVTIGSGPAEQPLAMDSLVHAAAAASPLVLKSFTAANGVLVGTFEVEGAIQTIKIGEVSGGTIKIDAPPAGLTVAPLVLTIPVDIHNGSIDSAIPIKSLTTVDWIDDDGTPDFLKAPSIGTITTSGNKKALLPGDFQADVAGEDDGDGNPTPTTLGSAKIAGSLTGATWNLGGVTTGIQVAGSVGSGANPVTINAVSIKSLKITGDLDHAAIVLSQPVAPKIAALGTLTVTGTVNDSSIVSTGNITTATVGRLIGSSIFASVNTANNAIGVLPDAESDFTPGAAASTAQITTLTIKGVKNDAVSFDDSVIAAGQLGTITLADLPTDGSASGGVAGESLLKSYLRTANKKVAFKLKGPVSVLTTIEQLDDYVARLV